jgi:hypothetical protein
MKALADRVANARAVGDTKLAEQLKVQLDALAAQNQLEMMQLQNLMNNETQSIELMSKLQDTRKAVIGNIR